MTMKPTATMIEAGAKVVALYDSDDPPKKGEQASTVDAIAEQIWLAMDEARPPEPGAGDGEPEPYRDPFEWAELGLPNMVAAKLQSQLRDSVLDCMRTMPNVWQKLTESQKRSLAQRCAQFSAMAITRPRTRLPALATRRWARYSKR